MLAAMRPFLPTPDSPDRAAALDAELVALGDRALASQARAGRDGMGWEYLVVTARVRG